MSFRKGFFFVFAVSFLMVVLAALGFTSCGDSGGGDVAEPGGGIFAHGVASGDPLSDRVILWTRVTPPEPQETVEVTVEVAADREFANPAGSPVTAIAGADRDYTVKVDFEGLEAGTVYYYRFRAGGVESPVGRTRTLPEGDVSSVRFAVVSCANYASGYFNVYGHAAQQADVDAVLHLGDYIYEYDTEGLALDNSGEVVRNLPADNDVETVTLNDYRRRYAVYRLDSQLRAVHAAHPFIAVWDDHELANNSWKDGASNHDDGEGDFEARKTAALQAYYEWMPIRENPKGPEAAYRSFSFGNLVGLHMLETRLVARDKELDYRSYFTGDGGVDVERFGADLQSQTLLGKTQLDWLLGQLTGSAATWQVLGQQTLMGRMRLPAELLRYLDNPSAELATSIFQLTGIKTKIVNGAPVSPEDQARIDNVLPYNLDAWDGYPREREAIFAAAYREDRNLVVLSGDTHNGWANDLKNAAGNRVGVEFAGSSVTSGGIEDVLGLAEPLTAQFSGAVEFLVDDLVYSNANDRGYMIVSFTPQEARSEWIYVDTVSKPEFGEKNSASKIFKTLPGEGNRKLVPVGD